MLKSEAIAFICWHKWFYYSLKTPFPKGRVMIMGKAVFKLLPTFLQTIIIKHQPSSIRLFIHFSFSTSVAAAVCQSCNILFVLYIFYLFNIFPGKRCFFDSHKIFLYFLFTRKFKIHYFSIGDWIVFLCQILSLYF